MKKIIFTVLFLSGILNCYGEQQTNRVEDKSRTNSGPLRQQVMDDDGGERASPSELSEDGPPGALISFNNDTGSRQTSSLPITRTRTLSSEEVEAVRHRFLPSASTPTPIATNTPTRNVRSKIKKNKPLTERQLAEIRKKYLPTVNPSHDSATSSTSSKDADRENAN